MPRARRRLTAAHLLVTLGAALALAACGDGTTTTARPAAPTTPAHDATVDALREKVALILQDECATKPPAQVYPSCPRYLGEVAAVAVAARSAAPGGTGPLRDAADRLDAASSAFTHDGCVTSPAAAPAAPATCGTDLQHVRDALNAVSTALGPE